MMMVWLDQHQLFIIALGSSPLSAPACTHEFMNVTFLQPSYMQANTDRYCVPNQSFIANRIIIFSRSSLKDPMDTLVKECA